MPNKLPCEHRPYFLLVAKGDKNAFRAIFDLYKSPFFAAAYKMTRSSYIAEEIVQEVFISLWTKREQVAAADNPSGYLFTILYNSIYAHFKKTASEVYMKQAMSRQMNDWEDALTEKIIFAREQKQLLDSVIGQLPPQQQAVFILSKQEGMSRFEIADRLHISPHSVKNHLHHAVKFIRLNCKGMNILSIMVYTLKVVAIAKIFLPLN